MTSTLSTTIANGFEHYFQDFRERVKKLADKLNEEQFWRKPFPYGNSFGNLVLHLTGNLNYYIGTQIEETGYQRDREREFSNIVDLSKTQAMADFDASVSMVLVSLRNQGPDDWWRVYFANGVDDVHDRFNIYLRCCVHFHHHIGQMTYLVKEWNRKAGE